MKPDHSLEDPEVSSCGASWTRWLWLALAVIVLDQLSKQAVLAVLALGQRIPVTDFFNIVLVHNPGAAFSMLADQGGWQRWLFTALGLGASAWMAWMIRQQPEQKTMAAALALVMGGAIGNVIDRVIYGHVIDFIDVHGSWFEPLFYAGHFPAFNIADSAISVGAVLLIADELLRARRARHNPQQD